MATFKELKVYIAALEAAYYRGLLTVTVDGVTTTFDNEAGLRARLNDARRELKKTATGASKKPIAASIDMSGFQ